MNIHIKPWNEYQVNTAFWDPKANDGTGIERSESKSIKETLLNPTGAKFEDLLRAVATGLVMVMNELEAQDPQPTIQISTFNGVPRDHVFIRDDMGRIAAIIKNIG